MADQVRQANQASQARQPGPRLTFSVANFGPVARGECSLHPLTIFIGPNNSGKSYMALLIYALTRSLASRATIRERYLPLGPDELFDTDEFLFAEDWLAMLPASPGSKQRRRSAQPKPDRLDELLRTELSNIRRDAERSVEAALIDYFGVQSVGELSLATTAPEPVSIGVGPSGHDTPLLQMTQDKASERPSFAWDMPDPVRDHARVGALYERLRRVPRTPDEVAARVIARAVWADWLRQHGITPHRTYYLPSARSGILQAWQLFASMAVQVVSRRAGLQRIDVPPQTGIAGDFLQVLLTRLLPVPYRQAPRPMRSALAALEGRLFGGQVVLETARPEQPALLYRTSRVEIPLNRASSMVAELAPLDLWIKYLLQPGDCLIIDEPEAHLHPENQRRIARVLVRLARAGVKVICPTHSSVILHQVSNHLLASALPEAERRRQGFSSDDVLSQDEVGVYLFDPRKDGTRIRPVPIKPGFGIDEAEFMRVAEAIGDETYRIISVTDSATARDEVVAIEVTEDTEDETHRILGALGK